MQESGSKFNNWYISCYFRLTGYISVNVCYLLFELPCVIDSRFELIMAVLLRIQVLWEVNLWLHTLWDEATMILWNAGHHLLDTAPCPWDLNTLYKECLTGGLYACVMDWTDLWLISVMNSYIASTEIQGMSLERRLISIKTLKLKMIHNIMQWNNQSFCNFLSQFWDGQWWKVSHGRADCN